MSDEDQEMTFEGFVELVNGLSGCSSHKRKSEIVSNFVHQGADGSLHNETALVLKLLLPAISSRIYNIKDKQLVNYFSDIFMVSREAMLEDLEKGDVATTLCKFFTRSKHIRPADCCSVLLRTVDAWLDDLAEASGGDQYTNLLRRCSKLLTADEFTVFIRLIKKDLRISAGAKQILCGLDPKAYEAFQASRDLELVVKKLKERSFSNRASTSSGGRPNLSRPLSVCIKLLTPVLPMLAEPCRSAEIVLQKGHKGGGLLVEIKYDGERIQVHKKGTHFAYFSRSLKPVPSHKVKHLKEFLPVAFPSANDLIIDSEVLLLDTQTKKPLPFGTLGVHKRTAFKDATVCLFVFDCLYFNGRSLLNEPIRKRREILEANMTVVPDRILLSEKHDVSTKQDLNALMAHVFSEGLEGLVLKPLDSVYEPGKRHWMKIKKDYLGEGSMADSADLIVLGAYFGTGNKGGLMSVFLMGAYDPNSGQFCTVTKCGNGLDDRTLLKLQKQFKMIKISKDYSKVPRWLNVSRSLVPDFVVADPKQSQVWEITGTEFTRAGDHTAGADDTGAKGISIRFPRVTKLRADKSWKEATDVVRLEALMQTSASFSDWIEKLDSLSLPKTGKRPASSNSADPIPHKKPLLKRIPPPTEMTFNHLRSIFEGFVISVPLEVSSQPEFNMLRRRLIACGATLSLSEDSDPTDEPCTHVIVADGQQLPQDPKQTPITVDWISQSIWQSKLLPLPVFS
ncbi:DNA ligase 3 [Sparganum proliferum]